MKAWHAATWEDPDDAATTKRRFSWGWLWLLLIPAALILFSLARFNDYWQYDDWTVATLHCDEPLTADPAWSDLQAAGCEQAPIPGAEVTLLDVGKPAQEFETDGTTWTFRNMPSAFSTMGLNVFLEEPAGRVFIVDASTTPPTVHREMTPSDVERTVFARNFGTVETTNFYVAVAPPE
ncbi:hypothetical protein FNH13_03420 [Ornithinimicrobium ciconiae]|uniref:Uncharacterized protein n=1 Tax=Ornithinimicrobium ciconiae TaxID=2594265 RepID=A0A516G7J3_9MICO|nr:hypothetical protein [Ornithinimicrobium ciconiae]QDO87501.1 hypothetical protein FNH13_03420 [Ornithinimicrobium ciconiae]